MAITANQIRLTKYGHACLFLEKDGKKLVVDPGVLTNLPDDLTNIAVVVVTEEHGDHCDINNLKAILAQSPDAKIFTTKGASVDLTEAGIASTVVGGKKTVEAGGFSITFYETDHAPVHEVSPCRSLAIKIDDFVYYPSDSYDTIPDPVEVLALPTSGPWHKLTEAIVFANAIKAPKIIATHNGMHSDAGNSVANSNIAAHLVNQTRQFIYLNDGQSLT